MLQRRGRLCVRPLDDKLTSYGQRQQMVRTKPSKIMMAIPEEMGRMRTSRKLLKNSPSSIAMPYTRTSFLENLTRG